MTKIGDRIETSSPKPGRRAGVVTGVSGSMVMVRWDTGEQTEFIPAPGVLRVVGPQPAQGSARRGASSKR
jgi:hypothetical protein